MHRPARGHRRLDRLGQGEPDREPYVHALAAQPTHVPEPCFRRPGTVSADQDRGAIAVFIRDLRDGQVGDRDVIGGGVRPGVAVAQQTGEGLVGVVQEAEQRVIAKRLVRAFLLRMADHQAGVEVQDQPVDGTPGRPRRGERGTGGLRALRPRNRSGPRPSRTQIRQHRSIHRLQDPPRGRRRGDRPEQGILVTQHRQVADRLTAISDGHRQVCPHSTRVMTGAGTLTGSGKGLAARLGQPRSSGEISQ
jgi:hypothetical protein